MKNSILTPLIFLLLLGFLIIYDNVTYRNIENNRLFIEDKDRFYHIVSRLNDLQANVNIDSFHFIIYNQDKDHESRTKSLNKMDSILSGIAEKSMLLP